MISTSKLIYVSLSWTRIKKKSKAHPDIAFWLRTSFLRTYNDSLLNQREVVKNINVIKTN